MKNLKLFIELTRLNKPIGFMLLFWPCIWGLTLSYDFNNEINTYIKYLIFFLLGSVLMRSAGCIVNDITDKKFDGVVIKLANNFNNISLLNEEIIIAGSSVTDKSLSDFAMKNSLGGFEFLSCIPGTIG